MRLLLVAALFLILVLCEAKKKHGHWHGHGSKSKHKSKNKSKSKSKESGEEGPWTPSSWNRCYSCTSAYTDQECNRYHETCQRYESACLSIVEEKTNGRIKITKRCAHLQECPGGYTNQPYCRGRVCYSCCIGDLCNSKAQGGEGPATPAPGKCPLGCKGERGTPGLPGRNGPIGIRGQPGVDASDGLPGRDGSKGYIGLPGPPGARGLKGDRGLDGQPGRTGPKGGRGMTGVPGVTGPKGDGGDTGLKGECDSQCNGGQGQIPTNGGSVTFSGTVFKVKQADDYFTICPTKIHVNEGTGFDSATGIMKTLVPGVYYFSCVSIADGGGATPCELYKNKERIFTTARDEDATGSYPLGTNQALVTLNVLDIVQFKVKPKKTGFWGSISNKFKSPSDITINGYLLNPAD